MVDCFDFGSITRDTICASRTGDAEIRLSDL
jgi:hypothetical protein